MTRSTVTILGMIPNGLAPHERARLFAGLESFVNAGDGLEDYQTLAAKWPTLWPHGSQAISWSDKAHAMFLDYRDKLRKLWRRDPEAQRSGVLAYLLGMIGPVEFVDREYIPEDVDALWMEQEIANTSKAYKMLLPGWHWQAHSMVFPVWGQTNFHYIPRGDFETALWVLFEESWRARICSHCERYFIADKPSQNYCSTHCSGEAKRGQKREWWKRAGKMRRAQRRIRTNSHTATRVSLSSTKLSATKKKRKKP